MEENNIFNDLNSVDVSAHVEKKGKFPYLSWVWAWTEVKKRFPDINSRVYESPQGNPYWTDGKTCWVKVGVTIHGVEHIEYQAVMDFNNRSIPLEKITSRDATDTIQRAVTKAIARHGLGLYLYAGEDLPDAEKDEEREREAASRRAQRQPSQAKYNVTQEADRMATPDELAKLEAEAAIPFPNGKALKLKDWDKLPQYPNLTKAQCEAATSWIRQKREEAEKAVNASKKAVNA